jgi:MFS family permease
MTSAEHLLLGPAESHASQQSLRSLDWLNLAGRGWKQAEIGLVLTVSGLTGLLFQVPGGELLDVVQSKRPLVALGVGTVAAAALILAFWPTFTPVVISEVLLGATGAFLGPAVAAISLGLVGNDGLPDRLGRNQRFAAIGGLVTAGLMGLLGYLLSNQAIFLASAALAVPTLVALRDIRADDIHFARACGAPPGD